MCRNHVQGYLLNSTIPRSRRLFLSFLCFGVVCVLAECVHYEVGFTSWFIIILCRENEVK